MIEQTDECVLVRADGRVVPFTADRSVTRVRLPIIDWTADPDPETGSPRFGCLFVDDTGQIDSSGRRIFWDDSPQPPRDQ